MENFLNATAWTMAEPKPYGLFHIVMLLVGIPVSIALAWKLRRVSDRSYHRILFAIAVILLLSELYKQLFHFYVMDNKTYDWWIFPFQLCSLPMYLCAILPFMKKSRWLIPLETFLMDFNLLGGLMALLVPDGLMHPYITLTLHAFVWHILLLFVGCFIGFSRHGDISFRVYKNPSDFTYLHRSCHTAQCFISFLRGYQYVLYQSLQNHYPACILSNYEAYRHMDRQSPLYHGNVYRCLSHSQNVCHDSSKLREMSRYPPSVQSFHTSSLFKRLCKTRCTLQRSLFS